MRQDGLFGQIMQQRMNVSEQQERQANNLQQLKAMQQKFKPAVVQKIVEIGSLPEIQQALPKF